GQRKVHVPAAQHKNERLRRRVGVLAAHLVRRGPLLDKRGHLSRAQISALPPSRAEFRKAMRLAVNQAINSEYVALQTEIERVLGVRDQSPLEIEVEGRRTRY